MLSVKLKDIRPGMVPAQDVKDRTGRVLIVAGNEITLKHIKVLKAWGVPEIKVREDADRDMHRVVAEKKTQVPDKVGREMLELFRYTDRRHPAIRELFTLCSLRKANQQ